MDRGTLSNSQTQERPEKAQEEKYEMAGKPIPNALKARRGTLRPGRSVAVVNIVQGEQPEPPEHLSENGKAVWTLILTEAKSWLNYTLDIHLLLITCEQMDERDQLRQLVIENPENPKLRTGLRELEKSLISNLSTLGLNPTERARLGFAQVKAEGKLEEILRKRDERRAAQAIASEQLVNSYFTADPEN
jgi:phage terminase small subunit